MKLSEQQQRDLTEIGLLYSHRSVVNWKSVTIARLLDIIDTLQRPDATPPAPEPTRAFEWVQDHPDGPDWYPVQPPDTAAGGGS